MRLYGKTTLSEFLGDNVVWRNLEPADPRLPGLSAAWREMGLEGPRVPRKAEPGYARAIVHLLWQAQALTAPGTGLSRLLYVGDTRLLDGTAYQNILEASGWPGLAFIATEKLAEPPRMTREGSIFVANRWVLLGDFLREAERAGLPLAPGTALVLDLDKTTFGARGRNDGAVDRARVDGVRETVADLLGPGFDQAAFDRAYGELNQPAYHAFTADNQDYLAYICLAIGAGMIAFEELLQEVQAGHLRDFAGFLQAVEAQAERAEPRLAALHRDIAGRVAAGDPTPFKAFRRREYLATVARLGQLPDDAPPEVRLREEILITEELREVALTARERGALLFGLSDKPDEASTPTPEQAAAGMQPLHRVPTHAFGESVFGL
ncbi:MAG: hypothetical protein K6V36_09775 [Anaerolineae bacterium]|nr:hypothetical protein [Anaerolineae bacterium]